MVCGASPRSVFGSAARPRGVVFYERLSSWIQEDRGCGDGAKRSQRSAAWASCGRSEADGPGFCSQRAPCPLKVEDDIFLLVCYRTLARWLVGLIWPLCIRPSTIMVTTRSQDKMTFADKIRAKGFSLADCKFFKLNALFPIMLGLAHATTALWCGSGLAAAVVGAIPVADTRSRSSPSSSCPSTPSSSRSSR